MRFGLLGPLQVLGEGGPLPLGGPKQRIVLAHLVLRANYVVPVGQLIDAVWGDNLPEDPRAALQTYVSRLRSVLGPSAIEGWAPGYLLRADPDDVDALHFEALLRKAHDGRGGSHDVVLTLDEALALWRGSAISDLADEQSLSGEIARLEELRLQAIEKRIEAEQELGRHAQVVAELETLTRANPLRERLWGELMLSLYHLGRQAEALAAFERARLTLADELGIDPSVDLRTLHERILRQDPDLDLPGQPLRGYRLLEKVGEGTVGVVYRAIQPQIGCEVAIKILPPKLANRPDFIRRFEREAQLVARLEHPHIVPVYDYWREPDAAYLIMPFLRGGNLNDLLAGGPLTSEKAATILDQVAGALSVAHEQGLVHGAVKASNILFDEEGNASLSDFGVALEVEASYPASPASDVSALGVVLREMRADHSGSSVPQVVDGAIERTAVKDPSGASSAVELASAYRAALGDGETLAASTGETRNPYKGLRAFIEADSADFFGRETSTARLVRRLEEDQPGARFLAVVGPSGSGKSSLVRAGLVPAIRGGALPDSDRWFVIAVSPSSRPFEELETALLGIAIEPPPSFLDDLERDEFGLIRAVDRVLPDPDSEVLIVVDQLEEVFTLTEDEGERARVLESLRLAALDPGSRVRIVATLRADFFDQPLSVRGFGDLLAARTEAITPMSPEELERAIMGPAESAGLSVEPQLLATMVADVVDQPGGLPLLQYALTELASRAGDTLTLSGYRDIGGASGALARRADRLFDDMGEGARNACRQVMLRLVTQRTGSRATLRRVRRSELAPLALADDIAHVLDTFGRYRLLSFDRDPATREPTVELAHEALVAEWARLRGWIDDARDDIRAQRKLATMTSEWEAGGRDPSFLLRGVRLDRTQAWSESTTLALAETDRAFVEASLALRNEEIAEQRAGWERKQALERRSVRRLRSLVALGVAAALAATTLAVAALNERGRAEDEAREAHARELAAAAVTNLEIDPERSILLASESVKMTRSNDGSVLPEAEQALHQAVIASRGALTVPGIGGSLDWGVRGVFATEGADGSGLIDVRSATTGDPVLPAFVGHDGDITDVAFGPDGSILATVGNDGMLKAWDPSTGDLLARVAGNGPARGLSFAARGSTVAAGWSREGVVRVVDLSTDLVVRTLSVRTVVDTALSPNGARVAVASVAEGVEVFDVTTGDRSFALEPAGCCESTLSAVSWSPDGRSIATAGPSVTTVTSGETGRVWDARTGALRYTLLGDGPSIAVTWSPDSSRLLSGYEDGAARVWDVAGPAPREMLALSAQETTSGVIGAAFSPDGSRVMTGDADRTAVKIWDLGPSGDAEWANLAATGANGVAFLPDGWTVVVARGQPRLTIWDLRTNRPGRRIGPLPFEALGVDVSQDGTRVAAAGSGLGEPGGVVAGAWDAATGQELFTISHDLDANNQAFSPDDRYLVTASWDGTAKIVDRSGHVVQTLRDQGLPLSAARFSPDGRLIATAAFPHEAGKGTSRVTLWDWRRGDVLRTFRVGGYWSEFDPRGSWIAMADLFGVAEIWGVENGRRLLVLAGPARGINWIAYSPDGSALATANHDGSVRLFDTETGAQRLVLRGHACDVYTVAFSRDGSKLASSSPCDGVRIWALDIDDLLEIAGQEVTRPLTIEECRRYLRTEACPQP